MNSLSFLSLVCLIYNLYKFVQLIIGLRSRRTRGVIVFCFLFSLTLTGLNDFVYNQPQTFVSFFRSPKIYQGFRLYEYSVSEIFRYTFQIAGMVLLTGFIEFGLAIIHDIGWLVDARTKVTNIISYSTSDQYTFGKCQAADGFSLEYLRFEISVVG